MGDFQYNPQDKAGVAKIWNSFAESCNEGEMLLKNIFKIF